MANAHIHIEVEEIFFYKDKNRQYAMPFDPRKPLVAGTLIDTITVHVRPMQTPECDGLFFKTISICSRSDIVGRDLQTRTEFRSLVSTQPEPRAPARIASVRLLARDSMVGDLGATALREIFCFYYKHCHNTSLAFIRTLLVAFPDPNRDSRLLSFFKDKQPLPLTPEVPEPFVPMFHETLAALGSAYYRIIDQEKEENNTKAA